MKLLFIALFTLIACEVFAQYPAIGSPSGNSIRGLVPTGFIKLPKGATHTLNGAADSSGYLFFQSGNKGVYSYLGNGNWKRIDSGSVVNLINDSTLSVNGQPIKIGGSGTGTALNGRRGVIISGAFAQADSTVVAFITGARLSGARLMSNSDGNYSDAFVTAQEWYLNNGNIADLQSNHSIGATNDIWSDSAKPTMRVYISKTSVGGFSSAGKGFKMDSVGFHPPSYDSVWRSLNNGTDTGQTIADSKTGTPYFWSGSTWVKTGTGSTYTPYALDTIISSTGIATVFTIPLPTLATYTLGNIRGFGDYKDSLSGNSLFVTFAVAPIGNVEFKISGSYTSSSAYSFKPKFGALVATSSNSTDIIALNNLGVSYTRAGQVVSAGAMPYLNFTNAGKKVLLTLNFATPVNNANIPFPTDTAAWRHNISTFLDGNSQVNVDGYNIINEANSNKYWWGYASTYLPLFHIGLNELVKRGYWGSDGGLTGIHFYYKVWEDYINRGYPDSAEDFRIRAGLPTASVLNTWRTDPAHDSTIRFLDTIIANYAATSSDSMKYITVHFYEPLADTTATSINPLTFEQCVWYAQRATGKPAITNEYGLQNMSPNVLVQMTQTCTNLKLAYAIGYSANQNYTWVNYSDGSLNAVGIAYKNYITSF